LEQSFQVLADRDGPIGVIYTLPLFHAIPQYRELPFHFSGMPMDRIDAMKTLLVAIEEGSLSAASRRLGMPLATVSRKVSELETHLRAQLVIRTSRKLMLTEAGEVYVTVCRRILEEIEDAERAVMGEYRVPRGHLTLTASVMFGQIHVEPVVLAFMKAYPDVTVRLFLSDSIVNILEDHIDAAIRVGPLPDSSMVATRLGETRWVTCASPEYLQQRGTPKTPEDLAAHDCIMFEGHQSSNVWSNEVWSFGQGKTSHAVPIKPRLRVNTASSAISAAVAGSGIVRLLSYQIVRAQEAGLLEILLPDFEPASMPVHLVHSGQAILPLKLRAFLDFAAPRLRLSLQGRHS
jgi:DNA-binding transcriptional LysR family regulator